MVKILTMFEVQHMGPNCSEYHSRLHRHISPA